ncbi:MAG: pyridoxamine 5'-phosphate oxidase family protein [Deltaproteobacteria bacterium]|nr:pyridoxamine 5'-phosphate oxidase family protein [Deltaproteobacteria bacterium]
MPQKIQEIVNRAGRIGTLSTADREGRPNVAYFGSARLLEDGGFVVGLAQNRTLANLAENPHAVFFCVEPGPVGFDTPGCRLYLKVKEIQEKGPVLNAIKKAIAEHAGEAAANMMFAAVIFDVVKLRPVMDMEHAAWL